jgi:hypothetical protein
MSTPNVWKPKTKASFKYTIHCIANDQWEQNESGTLFAHIKTDMVKYSCYQVTWQKSSRVTHDLSVVAFHGGESETDIAQLNAIFGFTWGVYIQMSLFN